MCTNACSLGNKHKELGLCTQSEIYDAPGTMETLVQQLTWLQDHAGWVLARGKGGEYPLRTTRALPGFAEVQLEKQKLSLN